MRVLLLSYGNIDFDGRLRELIEVSKKIGRTTSLTRGTKISADGNIEHHFINGGFLSFIVESYKVFNTGKYDLLFVDNRKATIPGLIIKALNRKIRVVYDMRELYITKEVSHFIGKVGCYFEKLFLKKADVVICANNERAQIMSQFFKLKKRPLVFENLRKLDYSHDFNLCEVEDKYRDIICDNKINIISTSGCDLTRTNDALVKAKVDICCPCRIILVGDVRDKAYIEEIIGEYSVEDVIIIGMVAQNDLKYLVSHSHIGIVNYGHYDTNNMYCASGKIYEYIFEELPIVATENPPLKSICEEYKIGIASSDYANAINDIINNFDYYKQNVKNFKKQLDIDQNNEDLSRKIMEELSS